MKVQVFRKIFVSPTFYFYRNGGCNLNEGNGYEATGYGRNGGAGVKPDEGAGAEPDGGAAVKPNGGAAVHRDENAGVKRDGDAGVKQDEGFGYQGIEVPGRSRKG